MQSKQRSLSGNDAPSPSQQSDLISILNISPQVDCGRYPVKRIILDSLQVSADVLKPGHGLIYVGLCHKSETESNWSRIKMVYNLENDRWSASFLLNELGVHEYFIEAWYDDYSSKLENLNKWVKAGENVSTDLDELIDLIKIASAKSPTGERKIIAGFLERIRASSDIHDILKLLLDEECSRIVISNIEKQDYTASNVHKVFVDREKARYSSWYEMFPRSQGNKPGVSATFMDCEDRLDDISEMGFDVIYLPPIHPIGHTNRRGPNNTPSKNSSDPGSPWAIGDETGGHYSIHQDLGTTEDFLHFLRAVEERGMEIALDLAYQCSPDHPYVKEHPEWFYHRKDGTIRYAENPPKKYYDIVPFHFLDSSNSKPLWDELLNVVIYWVQMGVRIFRVDNPHTKPTGFWKWLIHSVKKKYPGVIFLAEAFTNPKSMKILAKIGFAQSYTYFTWKNTKYELTEFLKEFVLSDAAEYYRGNYFANTPDILHEYLQKGGRPAFKIRLVLAAGLSSVYGIYNGFELCENKAFATGSEEYLNSEKYEFKVRDWNAPGNIKAYITKINKIRKENQALHFTSNLRLLECDNEHIFFFGKWTQDRSNVILIAVNLDPLMTHDGTVKIPVGEIGIDASKPYRVKDLITGNEFEWHGESNYVKLDPSTEPAHVLLVLKNSKSLNSRG